MPTSRDAGREGTIAASGLWKRFRSDRPQALLRYELARLDARLRKRALDRWTWALRDVSFDVDPGDSVGLIGINGSGKSTLLKLLTRVMYPYAGSVQLSGRVAALIELRAGLHPELTGAENVYFFGSLLGLPRKEVARRFDDIVSFAELGEVLDRQVKFYSSGMQMRLGFSVASFLDPDVLLVDEVLAVGDATFQQRCLDRMRDLLGQGVTLVFVSHDLAAIEATCGRAVWLDQGAVAADGPAREVLGMYRNALETHQGPAALGTGPVRLVSATVAGAGGGPAQTSGNVEATVVMESDDSGWGLVCLGVSEEPASPIFVLRHDIHLEAGETAVRCELRDLPLPGGRYQLWVGYFDSVGRPLLAWQPARIFDVAGPGLDVAPPAVVRRAPVHVASTWTVTAAPR